jgi:hypothetical protein
MIANTCLESTGRFGMEFGYQEGYAKLPTKMIKKLSDLRRQAAGGAASEGFA